MLLNWDMVPLKCVHLHLYCAKVTKPACEAKVFKVPKQSQQVTLSYWTLTYIGVRKNVEFDLHGLTAVDSLTSMV